MANFTSFAAFGREVDAMGKEIDRAASRKILLPMAEKAQKIADAAAVGDLGGNNSFSGWRRTNPIELVTAIKVNQNSVVVHPTKASAGPWTVAERGRNQGNASGFSGPGVNVRTGATSRNKSGALRKTRARKSRRWNGTTAGKQTATKAQAAMDKKLPPVGEDGFRKIARNHFDIT